MISERLKRIVQSSTKYITSSEQSLRPAGSRLPASRSLEESTIIENHDAESRQSESSALVADPGAAAKNVQKIEQNNAIDPQSSGSTTMELKSDRILPRTDKKNKTPSDDKHASNDIIETESLEPRKKIRKVTRMAAPVSLARQTIVADGVEITAPEPLLPKDSVSDNQLEKKIMGERKLPPFLQPQPDNVFHGERKSEPFLSKTKLEGNDQVEVEEQPDKQVVKSDLQEDIDQPKPVALSGENTVLLEPILNDSAHDDEEKNEEAIALYRQQENEPSVQADSYDMLTKYVETLTENNAEVKYSPQWPPVLQPKTTADVNESQHEASPQAAPINIEIGRVTFSRVANTATKPLRRNAARVHSIPMPHGLDD